ncbi:AraC family transcriptional regulator [Teichococcus oryzae]|uniref:AraC family transcriptional regulator n=1 Tax=Teichococcus oryzae TaxID=1608942 RepID=UPI0019D5D318|nr:AraC family transcriptional regulator [Pseudoroseomonas oryzae]
MHADGHGIARCGVPGLTTIYATAPSELLHDISCPLACLMVQGGKRVATGRRDLAFGAGDSLLITADVPTISQVTWAGTAELYLLLMVELGPGIIAESGMQIEKPTMAESAAVQVDPTGIEVTEAATSLMQLLSRPAAL